MKANRRDKADFTAKQPFQSKEGDYTVSSNLSKEIKVIYNKRMKIYKANTDKILKGNQQTDLQNEV